MLDNISAYVTLLIGLSVASERLVEIIKGAIPWLNQQQANATSEGWRRSVLHLLALASGIVTAALAQSTLASSGVIPAGITPVLALGLLASGGSSFWNSIASYLKLVKDLKKADVAAAAAGQPPAEAAPRALAAKA